MLLYLSIGVKIIEHTCEMSGERYISFFLDNKCADESTKSNDSCCKDETNTSSSNFISNQSIECCSEFTIEHNLNTQIILTSNQEFLFKIPLNINYSNLFNDIQLELESYLYKIIPQNSFSSQKRVILLILHIYHIYTSEEPDSKLI